MIISLRIAAYIRIYICILYVYMHGARENKTLAPPLDVSLKKEITINVWATVGGLQPLKRFSFCLFLGQKQ